VPDASNLARAELRQLDSAFKQEIEKKTWCTVQFNPESLKVGFANQLVQNQGTADQKGGATQQFVGAGTTKLSLQLWFDATAPPPKGGQQVDDVRKLTQKVAFFITPKPSGKNFVPPAVRFAWGSFQFDGLMDTMDETLEFFSPEGRPLRASVAIALSQQKITKFFFRDTPAGAPPGTASPGTQPLARAPAGSNLPQLAATQGAGADWQPVAAANGIEDALRLAPGQLVDLNARVSVGFGA
jgi:hypothetical protein